MQAKTISKLEELERQSRGMNQELLQAKNKIESQVMKNSGAVRWCIS